MDRRSVSHRFWRHVHDAEVQTMGDVLSRDPAALFKTPPLVSGQLLRLSIDLPRHVR